MLFRRFSLVAVLALGGLFAAACGDDDGGGGVGGGGGDSAFCDQARSLEEIDDADLSDEDALEQLQGALDDVPDEIQDDAQVLLDAIEAIESGDFEFLIENEEELTEATENLESFLADECGIDVEST